MSMNACKTLGHMMAFACHLHVMGFNTWNASVYWFFNSSWFTV